MQGPLIISALQVDEELCLDLHGLAAASGVEPQYISMLIEEALLQPPAGQSDPERWRFGGTELARVRRIRRLQHSFDADLDCVAVMLDLIDEIERLRSRLHRAGVTD